MNFEAPVSEWHIVVLGDNGLACADLFRDIAFFIPNDEGHLARNVLRTSMAATVGHWRGFSSSGARHVSKRMLYGNKQVFESFAQSVASETEPARIGPEDALAVLRLQHASIRAGADGDLSVG
jgi:hypothetical protein